MTSALVATRPGVLEVQDVELPALGPGDVRVEVAGVGVCHSDLSMVDGTLRPSYPLVLGHEASGVVTEAGPSAGVPVGRHVVLNWAVPCDSCWHCEHGEPWLCSTVEGSTGTPGGRLADGTTYQACLGLGAMAEEVVVPGRAVVPLPDDVPLAEAALLGCAILTGVGAAGNAARVQPGDSVLVVGLGGVGLSAVAGARLAGARKILATDIAESKEPLARAAGATDFLVASAGLVRQVRAMTDGRGVDRALECVGSAVTIRQAWSATRRGGTCVVVGVGSPDHEVRFNPLELFHFSRTLVSSVYGNSDPRRDIAGLLEHVAAGRLDLAGTITDRITLADVPAAFDRMRRGEGGRALVVFPPRDQEAR
ncbi:MAG TPA: zinc-binding dehydrogenase [Nocardioides sp.]|jgi:S-(hydroxymethyl)glutathione dehydrogenase/alcohol dehydrogenase|uniref:zinc-binding dehydrogenase n=1 Tax=Nocardioides sp. TaxID=35761 RepID=UPI002E31C7D9|nr:zinc-binding dehydrogenase [Nocardioides sp.]HEX3930161.1 zinc-binding dehydrogenase [Nocardioides sp.]